MKKSIPTLLIALVSLSCILPAHASGNFCSLVVNNETVPFEHSVNLPMIATMQATVGDNTTVRAMILPQQKRIELYVGSSKDNAIVVSGAIIAGQYTRLLQNRDGINISLTCMTQDN